MRALAYSTMGSSRDEHCVNIANHEQNWQNFEKLHDAVFKQNNLKKYKIVTVDGKIINASNDIAEAYKMIVNEGSVRHEDFLVIRDMIVEIRRRALNGINDLQTMGLSFPESISKQLVGFEKVTEFKDAEQSMNPNVSKNNDTNFQEDFVPCPITHSGFSIPWRQEGFAYKRSLGMNESIRKVAERLERTLFLGNTDISVSYGGTNFPIYGYTTHPDRGTGTISDWTVSANKNLIFDEINTQVGLMWSAQGGVSNDRVMLYVANDIWQVFQADYKADSEKSIMTRVKEISQIMDVKPAEYLPSGEAMLVEMERRTIELAVESDIIVVPHTKTEPMMPQAFTSYAAMTHHIKSDVDGNSGIRHLTTA